MSFYITDMKNYWRNIKGFSGYLVSNTGLVKSLPGRYKKSKKPYLLKPWVCAGYRIVQLGDRYEKNVIKVHRLVAMAFIPNPSKKKEVNHKDGNKLNNHVSNLEWCTRAENAAHAGVMGLMKRPSGVKNPAAKLSEKKVIAIIKLLKKGHLQKEIAAKYSVVAGTISHIANKTTWSHITK
jgi:hypothetical protein